MPISNSKEGMKATLWGYVVWMLWFLLASYHEEEKMDPEAVAEMLQLYLDVLYCKICRQSYNDFWFVRNVHEAMQQVKQTLVQYVHWLHNQVNCKLLKPDYPIELLEESVLKPERLYRHRYEMSPHFQFFFWTALYLLAANYPTYEDSEMQRKAKSSRQLLNLFLDRLLPISDVRNRLTKIAPPERRSFKTRQEFFALVYRWESLVNDGCSRFGSSEDQVADYFESHFRASASGKK